MRVFVHWDNVTEKLDVNAAYSIDELLGVCFI